MSMTDQCVRSDFPEQNLRNQTEFRLELTTCTFYSLIRIQFPQRWQVLLSDQVLPDRFLASIERGSVKSIEQSSKKRARHVDLHLKPGILFQTSQNMNKVPAGEKSLK